MKVAGSFQILVSVYQTTLSYPGSEFDIQTDGRFENCFRVATFLKHKC
jgi:hypothetical protein